jgi:hypothetical protein
MSEFYTVINSMNPPLPEKERTAFIVAGERASKSVLQAIDDMLKVCGPTMTGAWFLDIQPRIADILIESAEKYAPLET